MNLKTNWLIYFSKISKLKFFPFSLQQNFQVSFLWNPGRPRKSLHVVYKFTCLCDTSLVYIGKIKQHLGARSKEHRDLEKPLGEVETDLKFGVIWRKSSIKDFQIIKKWLNDQDAKINESIIIRKKKIPPKNNNLFNCGSMFTSSIYY